MGLLYQGVNARRTPKRAICKTRVLGDSQHAPLNVLSKPLDSALQVLSILPCNMNLPPSMSVVLSPADVAARMSQHAAMAK